MGKDNLYHSNDRSVLARAAIFADDRLYHGVDSMKPSALFLLLALAGVAPAYAGNTEAGLGGAVGGVLGTLVGQQVGGSTGAAIGAGVGGAAGGVLGADRRNRTEAAIGGGLGAAGGNVIGNRIGGSTGGLVGAALGGGAGGALGNNLGDDGRDDRRYRDHHPGKGWKHAKHRHKHWHR